MPNELRHNAYFFSPRESKPDCPLLIFLPGLDVTGEDLIFKETYSFEAGFDVRCFIICPEDIDDFDLLAESALALTKSELDKNPDRSVYLCGESFGGCVALKMLMQAPDLFERIVLVNPASSFHRVPWLYFGSLLFPLTPNFLYDCSAFFTLPFLVSLNRVSFQACQGLIGSIESAPKRTAQQRIAMMREFTIDENKLRQITQPVLLIGSAADLILPSVEEAWRLARIFPQSTVVTLPHSGHACLVETDVNLCQIMRVNNFAPKHQSTFL